MSPLISDYSHHNFIYQLVYCTKGDHVLKITYITMFVRKFDHHILLLKAAAEIPNCMLFYFLSVSQLPSQGISIYLRDAFGLSEETYCTEGTQFYQLIHVQYHTHGLGNISAMFELQENRRCTFPHFCLNVKNLL